MAAQIRLPPHRHRGQLRRMVATVATLLRYPVKGLPGQRLEDCAVAARQALPMDRRWALAHGQSRFDPGRPGWVPRSNFVHLAAVPRLATIGASFDAEASHLSLTAGGTSLAGHLDRPSECRALEAFVSDWLADPRGPIRIVESPSAALHDAPIPLLSLISRASIDDLVERSGAYAETERFRANIVIAGCLPWEEFGWLGRTVRIGGASFRAVDRIERCAAIDVEPGSGRRTGNLLASLHRCLGHTDAGVFLECIGGGILRTGDAVDVA